LIEALTDSSLRSDQSGCWLPHACLVEYQSGSMSELPGRVNVRNWHRLLPLYICCSATELWIHAVHVDRQIYAV